MKIILSSLMALIGLSICASAQQEIRSSIDSLAGEQLKRTSGSGFVIGINRKGFEEIYYYGTTGPGKMEHADSSSIFELGQMSSVFTTLLFSDMAVEGEVRMDDFLQKFLPVDVPAPVYQRIVCQPMKDAEDPYELEYSRNKKFTPYVCLPDPNDKPQPILLCYLATHTSGLPENPFNLKSPRGKNNPYSLYSKADLYSFLKSYKIAEPIGYDYHYSGLGIALLGHALSLKSGKDFESLVAERIFRPLGMNSTSIIVPEEKKPAFLNGYSDSGKPMEHWTYDILAPAGAFHSTIADMMRFLSANLGTRETTLRGILDYSHNPRIRLSEGKLKGSEVALGWIVNLLQGTEKRYVWSSGKTAGFSSYIGFVETSQTGVVVLSNSSVPVDEMGIEILKIINR